MAYEALDIHDGAGGARRWLEAGRPTVPSLSVAGAAVPILHVSQIASALGLPAPPGLERARLAWDLAGVLDAWVERLRGLDWELLTRPTKSRGRSLRNLTVNVFHPVELLPEVWVSGRFDWDPDGDRVREGELSSAEDVVRYAEGIEAGWSSFLLELGDEIERRDPRVASPRGEVTYTELLASQVWHAGFHLREVEAFLR